MRLKVKLSTRLERMRLGRRDNRRRERGPAFARAEKAHPATGKGKLICRWERC